MSGPVKYHPRNLASKTILAVALLTLVVGTSHITSSLAALDQPIVNLDPFQRPSVSAPVGSADLASRLGVNIHFTRDAAALDAARLAGFTWIRMDLAWADVEIAPGVYDFSGYDQLITDLEARDMRALLILDYGHPLYTGGSNMPPITSTALEAIGRYAETAARHFAGHGICYEIWNEPNTYGFWLPQPNAAQYAALSNSLIARVRLGDPQAQIVTGGLSGMDYVFLRDCLNDGAATGASAIGLHPYRWGAPETAEADVSAWRSIVSETLSSNLPTWDTEWGYSATWFGDGHTSEARTRQAVMAARELLTAWSAGFPLIVYYDLRDDGLDPSNAEHNFGLLARDYSAKPAMQAVQALTAAAHGRQFTGVVPLGSTDLHALRLDGVAEVVMVLWSSSAEATVRVPASGTAVDMLGKPLALQPVDNQLELVISEAAGPVYLTFPQYQAFLPLVSK